MNCRLIPMYTITYKRTSLWIINRFYHLQCILLTVFKRIKIRITV